jgi:hypothetical protein
MPRRRDRGIKPVMCDTDRQKRGGTPQDDDRPEAREAPGKAATLRTAKAALADAKAEITRRASAEARLTSKAEELGGHIAVAWTLERAAGGAPLLVEIIWRERGGPPVRPPTRRGCWNVAWRGNSPVRSSSTSRPRASSAASVCRSR